MSQTPGRCLHTPLTGYSYTCTKSEHKLYKEERPKKLDLITAALVIVGGLNWGLVAVAEFDLVAAIFGLEFGETNAATRIVYGLVGPPPCTSSSSWSAFAAEAGTPGRGRVVAEEQGTQNRPADTPAGSFRSRRSRDRSCRRRVGGGLSAAGSRRADERRGRA